MYGKLFKSLNTWFNEFSQTESAHIMPIKPGHGTSPQKSSLRQVSTLMHVKVTTIFTSIPRVSVAHFWLLLKWKRRVGIFFGGEGCLALSLNIMVRFAHILGSNSSSHCCTARHYKNIPPVIYPTLEHLGCFTLLWIVLHSLMHFWWSKALSFALGVHLGVGLLSQSTTCSALASTAK